MKILYLDTSSSYLYIGIYNNGIMLEEHRENLGSDLSTFALNRLANALEKCNIEPKEIDKIILANGPGSFTGIRIGTTIAKVYAWALKTPITVISSLEAMAVSAANNGYDYIIPMIDARRESVYTAIYNNNNELIMKEQYTTLAALRIAIDNLPGKSICISNDHNINTELEMLEYVPNFKRIIETYKDKEPVDPHFIDANYLKKTEAEEKRESVHD